MKGSLDPKERFKFSDVGFVFGNLAFSNHCIRVNNCSIRSGIHRSNELHITVRECYLFCSLDNYSNVAMHSTSICGWKPTLLLYVTDRLDLWNLLLKDSCWQTNIEGTNLDLYSVSVFLIFHSQPMANMLVVGVEGINKFEF